MPFYKPMRPGSRDVRTDVPDNLASCYICEKLLPREDFHLNSNRKNGLAKYCKVCDQLRVRAYRRGFLADDVKLHMKNGTLNDIELGATGAKPVKTPTRLSKRTHPSP